LVSTDKNGVEFFKSGFSEQFTFNLDQSFEELTLKVYATLDDSSEKLIVIFKYQVKSNLIQLFD